MSNNNGPPSPNIPFNQYSIWSGMAGSIVALIMSSVLSLNQPTVRHNTTTEPAVQELVNRFSQDATNFLNSLNSFCRNTNQDLPQRNCLPAPTNSKRISNLSDSMDLNNLDNRNKKDNKHSNIKKSTDEETGQVCIIEEEISEVSNYTVDPITNKIKISTVEEYSQLATCTVIKNQGIQAGDFLEDEQNFPGQTIDNQDVTPLQKLEKPKLRLIEEKEVKDDSEPCEEIIVESPNGIEQKSASSAEKLSLKDSSNEKVSSTASETSLSETAEVVLLKKLTDAFHELRTKKSTIENTDLPPQISETSPSEGTEETLLKKLTGTFSKKKEVDDVPVETVTLPSETDESVLSASIEETILKKLNETYADSKLKQPFTSNISINTDEKYPEPTEKTDKSIEVEPETSNVYTQNIQLMQNTRNVQTIQIKENTQITQNFSNLQTNEVKQKLNIKKNIPNEIVSKKPNNVIRKDRSKEPLERIPPKRRSGGGAIEEIEKVLSKRRPEPTMVRNFTAAYKKEQKSKPQAKPLNNFEGNKRNDPSKNRFLAKLPR